MIISCSRQASPKEEIDLIKFDKFLNLFKPKSLPLNLNRRSVFDLSKDFYDTLNHTYKNRLFKEINDTSKIFLPREINDDNLNTSYRALYSLPKFDNCIPVLIAKDIFVENEQRQLSIYLVTYNFAGKFIDSYEIGGYDLDNTEKFTQINQDNSIIVSSYKFQKPPNDKIADQFYLLETKTTLSINDSGSIIRNSETTQQGYFTGDWNGYSYNNDKTK
jgi:hypothetical protein